MRTKITTIIIPVLICITSIINCVSDDFSNHKNESTSKKECAKRSQEECNYSSGEHRCIWNIDACRNQYGITAPDLPPYLGKVKQVVIGKSVCVIDFNDQLWCFKRFNDDFEIYPHSSLTFSQISINKGMLCGTLKSGRSKCFANGNSLKNSSNTTNIVKTFAGYASDKTSCTIDDQKDIECDSDIQTFEDFGTRFSGLNLAAKPKHVYLGSSNAISVLLEDGGYLSFMMDSSHASGWRDPTAEGNIESVDSSSLNTCKIKKTDKSLICSGGEYDSGRMQIPAAIANEEFKQVASGQDHTCAILANDGKLKCWGMKSRIENIPKNLKGVKQVASGVFMTCIIDKDDELECFAYKS